MRAFAITTAVVVQIAFAPIGVRGQADRRATNEDVHRWFDELSNWGRWGKTDELGAFNLITPEKRKQAARLVSEGVSVSLARNVEKVKAPDNPSPFEHTMLATGRDSSGQWAMDNFSVSFHGYAHTHMDALCHIFHKGRLYNGFAITEIGPSGAAKLSIHNLKNGIFTRGILMDIPRLKGVPYLEPGTPIYPADLDAWEKKAGLNVSSGDAVLIRTGRWARRDAVGPWSVETVGVAGLHVSCVKWLKQRDVAILGSDAASDVLPSGLSEFSHPVHLLTLNAMGVHILDNCELEELGRVAARYNRWAFLLTAAPLAVEGGTGSPLNPIATY